MMPLFRCSKNGARRLNLLRFRSEKDLQTLIEHNLETIFGARLVATEFSTGAKHAGRIDSLALDENENPVIIEYKLVESSDLVNQSLFYLSWLDDHKADFELAARKRLGENLEIDWDKIRVICIAPGFKKYDLHAVGMIGANIELWQYQLYDGDLVSLEKVFPKANSDIASIGNKKNEKKNPVMVEAGKKAAETRRTAVHSFEQHLSGKDVAVVELVKSIRDFSLGLAETVEESPKKFYIAYKVSQNFLCVEVQKKKVSLFLKLDPKLCGKLPSNARDVSKIGHYGTGDVELTITSHDELESSKDWIRRAFENVGG